MKTTLCILLLAMLLATSIGISTVAAQEHYTIKKAPTETDCIAKKTKFEHAERAFIDNAPSLSCPDNFVAFASNGAVQLYHGFGFDIPTDATIDGIVVKLDAWVKTPPGGDAYFKVSLSWDGGIHYTEEPYGIKSTGTLTSTETTYALGGSTIKWRRTWEPYEFSDANFRVKILAFNPDTPANDLRLDYISVKVYYHM